MTGFWSFLNFLMCAGKDAPEFFALPTTVFRGVFCGNEFNIRSAEFLLTCFSETFQMTKKKTSNCFLSFDTLHIGSCLLGRVFYCRKFEASYMLVTMGIFNVILAAPWIEQPQMMA